MIKPIFNRYERKYIVTSEQKNELIQFFKDYLIFDPYSIDGKSYTIYSVYFDTQDFGVIRNSISKPKFKDKLRMRSYTCPVKPQDMIFLEIKKKFDGRVNKRRINLTYEQAQFYLERGIKPTFDDYMDNQILNEIDYFIHVHRARPGAFISYERVAMMSTQDELRLTFDHNILFRNKNVDLMHKGGISLLEDESKWLMEVKSNDNFPLWLARKLSEYELYSQSFSKYGKAYKQYLVGGNEDDHILYHY
jgi:SPX domain protein involved in polyphosphate accumulation